MHKVIGAIIKKESKILMVDRKNPPFGWACPAGHIEEGETPDNALLREIREETGLTALKFELIDQTLLEWNICSRGERGHYIYIYDIIEFRGTITLDKNEHRSIEWKNINDLKKLSLEPAWEYWFKRLKIL